MLTPFTIVNIGGYDYTLKPLKTAHAREALAIVHSMLGAMEMTEDFNNIVSVAQVSGVLPDDKLARLVDLFGGYTTVKVPDDKSPEPRLLMLSKETHQDELFTGQIELQYEWLDASIKYNFERALGKTAAAFRAGAERMVSEAQEAAEKAKSKSRT